MGELAGAELDQVMGEWRQTYEHALRSGFSYNNGAGGWREGGAARRAYYRWAGIPGDMCASGTPSASVRPRSSRNLGRVKAATV